ncbi:MAG: hypothetical protein IKQ59_00905 [Prevotella sp.]|nr:hypothetical protein [Prevotella sp.]
MTKKLLLSVLLLFVGVSMQAQSVATEQMDERFNDGTKMPFGWFGEGWKVDDGKAKAEATDESSGFDFSQMMNMNQENSEGTPNMMQGMFGGPRYRTYLLTPPVVVKDGENLVFSASKPSGDDNGMGFSFDMKAIMGMTDTIFVVERSVYGRNQWVRVGDFTTTLNNEFQTFTISGTPAGEYRFRFVSYVNAEIDSVAGFHIDNEAPDLLVTVDSLHTRFVDYSVCDEDSTKEFILINTGTGTLKVNIESRDPELFSLDQSHFEIAAGDSAKLNVTFNYGAGEIGKNESMINFICEDTRLFGTNITVAALITDPEVWATDFNDDQMPFGCFGEGFVVKEGVATHYNPAGGGMAAMAAIFGGGGASDWFMTPPLTIQGVNDAVVFSLKNGDGSYKGPIIDPQANVTIEKTIYGSNEWERVDAYQLTDTLYHTKWIAWLPAGDYRFRFVSGDSLCIDSIAGGRINMNAPDLLVRHNGSSVQTVNYGICRGNQTKTFQLINTGTSELQLYAMSSDPAFYSLSQQMFSIAAGESATVDVTFNFDPVALGAHQAALVLIPQNCQIATQMIYLSAYITYEDAWTEDFEPEFVVEEGETVDLPIGWSTTGWQIIKGGGMDMMAMMGMGGGEKSWAPHTDNDAYNLITPSLQAKKGDVLRFYADISSGWLNLFYKCEDDADWTYQNTYITADSIYFIAPLTGIYQLKFTGSSVAVDDFVGFLKPMQGATLMDDSEYDTQNAEVIEHFNGQKVNVYYDRVLSAVNNGYGSWTPKAYTLCLPYEFRFGELIEPGKVKFYQLSFVDDYYKQFVFTAVADVAEAGKAYLAVVEEGDVSLNAYNVTLNSQSSTLNPVYDYADWFFNENLTKVGQWEGSFKSISATEADGKNMYCLLDDGSWVRFTSEDNPDTKLNAFRAYFLSDEPAEVVANASQRGNIAEEVVAHTSQRGNIADNTVKVFRTLFSNAGVANVSDSNVPDASSILYEADIPTPESISVGIQPTIITIDSDGTSRYFDLQGRKIENSKFVNSKWNKGLFIENGKKTVNK